MSSAQVSVSGKVISSEIKEFSANSVLKIKVRAATGQKKKDTDAYAPSNIYSIEVWGAYGAALFGSVGKDSLIVVHGFLGVPYMKLMDDGEFYYELPVVNVSKVDVLFSADIADDTEVEEPVAAKKTSSKKTKKVEEEDADDVPF